MLQPAAAYTRVDAARVDRCALHDDYYDKDSRYSV